MLNPRIAAFTLLSAVVGGSSALAEGPANKVEICHFTKSAKNPYQLITVSASAVAAHLGHGDKLSGSWYLDGDGDGYGDATVDGSICPTSDTDVTNTGDCDDGDPDVNPDAAEVCDDGVDNNCDGDIDEGCGPIDDFSICPNLVGSDLGIVPTWEGDCDAIGGTEYSGHCYYLTLGASFWPDARATCEAAGGYLATIADPDENNVVESFGYRVHIGMCDAEVEGTFTWITDEPVTFTSWTGGEPNNVPFSSPNGEDVLGMGGDYGIYWNDIPENFDAWSAGFVCEFQ